MPPQRVLASIAALVCLLLSCGSPTARGPSPSPTPLAASASESPTPTPTASSPSPSPSPSKATPTPCRTPACATATASPAASPPTAARTTSAIQPGNTPTGIAGASNGQLAPGLLVSVDPRCQAYRPAASSLARLFTIARSEGVSLSASECYRPIELQAAARSSNCAQGNCACAGPPGHSMHGWGEAVDFRDATGSVNTFTSPTYRWLTQVAAQFGWNHPGWAVPGGSPCPEPWHWEWVGDGGSLHAVSIRADVVTLVPTATGQGYRVVTGLGAAVARGDAGPAGSSGDLGLNRLIVGGAAQPGGGGAGYWLVSAEGGVFAYGGAPFLGSLASATTTGPGPTIAAMAATPGGKGYWLMSTDGNVFPFGDAPALSPPAGGSRYFVGIASNGSGRGAWLAASNGEVIALGDAPSFPAASTRSMDPIVAIAATPSGNGYCLASSHGQVFAYGDASLAGSLPSPPAEPVVSLSTTPSGRGYWLVTAGGSVYALGDAGYNGGG